MDRPEEISATASLSPGVGRLLQGKKAAEPPLAPDLESYSPAPAEEPATGFLRGILIFADFLLIGMAAVLALKSTSPFGFVEITLCSLAVGLGGVLSCVALLWRR
jgi:hypothetical protein